MDVWMYDQMTQVFVPFNRVDDVIDLLCHCHCLCLHVFMSPNSHINAFRIADPFTPGHHDHHAPAPAQSHTHPS